MDPAMFAANTVSARPRAGVRAIQAMSDRSNAPHMTVTALSECPQSCSPKVLRSRGNASAGLCRW